MTEPLSNDVFISYRRDVAGILAMALYQNLTEHGVNAFYDIESIRAGHFDSVILTQIAVRPYFLLVLTPGTLARCEDDRDWLRREIEQALATDRLVVPVYTPAFDFDDVARFLPSAVAEEVARFNGLEVPQQWFKYAVVKLVDEFLVPIGVQVASPEPGHEEIVGEILEAAASAPTVTEEHLSAYEYFERANGRPDADVIGQIADYSEALRLKPDYVEAYNNRGHARHDDGDLAGAEADFTEAIRLKPDLALPYDNRGIIRAETGDLTGALADYTEAIRLAPFYAPSFFNRGNARGDHGDVPGAIADYTEAIRLDPDLAAAYHNRAIVRAENGDPRGAIADYTEAVRLEPDLASAYDNRGVARFNGGDLTGAIDDYSEAIRLKADSATTFYNRGEARSADGDRIGAIADFTEAIRLKPDFVEAYRDRGLARGASGDKRGARADAAKADRLSSAKTR
jgi:tetratricopeptide (TPR) repeat protein